MSSEPDPRVLKLVRQLDEVQRALSREQRRASQYESLWRKATRTADAAPTKKKLERRADC
jgi:hypothetical protein